ncbi:MAG: hypothetical protein IPG76_22835 [Acidobacteria bacterium]|nr:hypothetical protein [Acidobacteriota bacterium]
MLTEGALDLLSTLVERYEGDHYDFEPSGTYEILQHLMEARDLKQKDVAHFFDFQQTRLRSYQWSPTDQQGAGKISQRVFSCLR